PFPTPQPYPTFRLQSSMPLLPFSSSLHWACVVTPRRSSNSVSMNKSHTTLPRRDKRGCWLLSKHGHLACSESARRLAQAFSRSHRAPECSSCTKLSPTATHPASENPSTPSPVARRRS